MKTIDQRLGYEFPVLLHLFTVFFHCSISKKLYFLFEKISQNKQNRKDIRHFCKGIINIIMKLYI